MDICPSCGASNALGASWCNQCFAALGDPVSVPTSLPAHEHSPPPPPPEPAPEPAPARVPDPVAVSDPEASWTCKTCEEMVPISVEACPSCLTSIYENFGATRDERSLDQKELAIKAIVPGRAHSTPKSPLGGVLIFMVVAMSLLIGLMLLTTAVAWAGVFVLMWGFGVWAFSIWDAAQSYVSSTMLLQPRVSMVVGLVPLLVIIGAVLTTVRP